MAETEGASPPKRLTITLPPRSSFESFFTAGSGLSPGPITLISNFFSDSDCPSFSQLLAGAMASPVAAIAAAKPNFLPEISSDKENNSVDGNEKNLGFRQNRPMNLVVAPTPMFMIPSGLTPSGLLNSPGFFSPVQSPFGMSHQQALAHVTAQAALSQSFMHIQEHQFSSEPLTQNPSSTPSQTLQEQMHTVLLDLENTKMESSEVSQSDKIPLPVSLAVDKPVNDGYNWRKYGQKQVKASEFPRSYYKCTHLNCPVKKKVERSLDGQISEIIYKGQHNHDLPRPNKHAKDGGDLGRNTNSRAKPEVDLQSKTETSWSVEAIPTHPVLGNDQVPTQMMSVELHGSIDLVEIDDDELKIDEEDDEPNPKRRNTEVEAPEIASSHKAVTESRIIVQTRSEVDLLDDGYKWRKYGQKVVKGNSHPRSYYKCTYAGCSVRKHVERASTDPKAVVTSYEGKHNHDVPTGRNNSANSNTLQSKPQKVVVARKPALHKEMDFGKDQRQVLLQLKEERITA